MHDGPDTPAPSLRELQEWFWRSLAERPGADDAQAPEPGLVRLICPTPRMEPEERLQVYRRMYFWRITDALREDFPRVAALVGEDEFQALVRAYLARHSSTHPSLRHVGRELPAFIAASPTPAMPPFLGDLARLEWARVEVFDAPDAAVLTPADLRAVPAPDWPGLCFSPVPALQVLVTDWPVHRVWDAVEGTPTLAPARTTLRVWRDGFVVYHAPMDPLEEAALTRLIAGQSFGTICEAFESPEDAASLLLRWLEDGIIARAL